MKTALEAPPIEAAETRRAHDARARGARKELVVQHAHAEEVLAAAVRDFTQSENEVREAEEKLKEANGAVDKKNTAKSFD